MNDWGPVPVAIVMVMGGVTFLAFIGVLGTRMLLEARDEWRWGTRWRALAFGAIGVWFLAALTGIVLALALGLLGVPAPWGGHG